MNLGRPLLLHTASNIMTRQGLAWPSHSMSMGWPIFWHQLVLQSVAMPTKNFFLLSLLTPTRSSYYPHPCYSTSTLLNCQPQNYCPVTSTLLNCTFPFSDSATSMLLNCHSWTPSWNPSSSTTLNCRLAQTTHDMPSSHVGHLSHLRLLSHLRH
jgi:hypothetical protein